MLAWERVQRLGWRVTVSAGIPAVMTRPGRLLLRYCEWVAGGSQAADLRRLLQSGDCAPAAFEAPATVPPAAEPSGALTPGQAARLLLKAQTTWGRATYAPSLAALAARYLKDADHFEAGADEHRVERAQRSAGAEPGGWIDGVLTAIPSPDAGNLVSLATCPPRHRRFLGANASRASAVDAMAAVALDSALADLANGLGDHRCDLASALGFLRAGVEAVTVGRDRPRPGALHVSSLADAGYDGRPHVFIAGLQEGGVFPRPPSRTRCCSTPSAA